MKKEIGKMGVAVYQDKQPAEGNTFDRQSCVRINLSFYLVFAF